MHLPDGLAGLCYLLTITCLVGIVSAEGTKFGVCETPSSINANVEKWGTIASQSSLYSYPLNQGCYFYINVDNPQYEYISFKYLSWYLDGSSSDRLTMVTYYDGAWRWVNDFYYGSGSITPINNYRQYGSVRFYWYTDATQVYSGQYYWEISFTFQKYVFGCELFPQPYMFSNTTQYGVIKSPFFPDAYPVNSYCQTIIDVDEAVDIVEFTPVLFDLERGDAMNVYIGNFTANDWVLYNAFTTNPGIFRIYGNDIKIIFTSDYLACSYGYMFYWRVFKRERYPIYKKESLLGYWPMTAYHQANDIIQGCNADKYPSSGSVQPVTGPFGDHGSSLYLQDAYFNMSSETCTRTTAANGSITVSAFMQTTVKTALVEWNANNAANFSQGPGANIWTNSPTSNSLTFDPQGTDSDVSLSAVPMQKKWQYLTLTYDTKYSKSSLSVDGKVTSSGTVSSNPPTYGGFLFGIRDPKYLPGDTSANVPQKGKFSCLSMHSEALSPYDVAQMRVTCEKLQNQFSIFKPLQSPWGWWPLNSDWGFMDLSGNGFHGEPQSTVDITLSDGPNTLANTAYYFNSLANAYATFPHAGLNLAYGSFTISFYARTTDATAHYLLEFFYNNARGLYVYRNGVSGTTLTVNLNSQSGAYTVSAPIGLTVWQFISIVYDTSSPTSNSLAIFLNGVQSGILTGIDNAALVGSDSGGFYLGRSVTLPTDKLIGSMACLSIYKMAMNAAQMKEVMEACKSNIDHPPGELVGLWPLTGTTKLNDISGHGYHGTANSPTIVTVPGPFNVPDTAYKLGVTSPTDYIYFPSPDLSVGKLSYTISIFVKHEVAEPAPLIEFIHPTAAYSTHIWVDFPSNNQFFINPMNGGGGISTAGFTTGKWQFISAVYDSINGKLKLYRDGASMGTGVSNPLGPSSTANTSYGFKVGYRASGNVIFRGQVACLSFYRAALNANQIGKIKSMCHNFLLEGALQDQTVLPEFDCNFDSGFCGWQQDTNDDGVDWTLGHDSTPSGQTNLFYTGPRMGMSAERADALDQYALINSADLGINRRARLRSPFIAPGWHCFEFWYYMAGRDVKSLSVLLLSTNKVIWTRTGSQGHQWNFVAIPFYVAANSWEEIAFDGISGSATYFADIAIDKVRLTEGRCASSQTPCPKGWLDYGRKCYMDFSTYSTWSRANALNLCNDMLKARLPLPEDAGELAFLQSFGVQMHLDPTLISASWVNSFYLPVSYLQWKSSYPIGGTADAMAVNAGGMIDYISSSTNMGFLCEVTKLEAMYLGFNCTFDNKHLCGWTNSITDQSESKTGSLDLDVSGGIALPWYDDKYENGPEWDWNKGNLRGYYLMYQDKPTTVVGIYSEVTSPIIKATKKPQCLSMRVYRSGYSMSTFEVWVANVQSITTENIVQQTVNWAQQWRTVRAEIHHAVDYYIKIRVYSTGNGWGNQIIDDIQILDQTCGYPLLSTSLRPVSGFADGGDTLGDARFYTLDTSTHWRNLFFGDNGDWTKQSWTCPAGQRRSGPQSDYDGESSYALADLDYLTSTTRFSGPRIPAGSRCFIFHYFQYGYDIGEIRLTANGRYIWASQGQQSPAWNEHRILFTDTTPTLLVFEGSGGVYDSDTHFAKYNSLQIDDIWTRNGTDMCLGFMDCNFDDSAYLSTCGWEQNDTDDSDWIRNSGETPTGNVLTGPGADHTTGGGHYLYFESTNLKAGAKARIHMPAIASGNFCLTFYYYMWGQDIANLRVFYAPMSNLAQTGKFPIYSEVTLWQKGGQQGNLWLRAMVPVTLSYPQVLTFEATRGVGDRGDIAIDDVVLLEGSCPSDRGFTCSFERGDLCAWHSDSTAARQFVTGNGKTPGAPFTGPEGDATGAYAGGYYAYLSSSNTNPGDVAALVSPQIPAGTVCFQMRYNMRGRQLGQLAIYRNSDLITRIRAGSTGYDWRRLRLTIASPSSDFTIKIEAKRGYSSMSDIGIDDIKVANGPCSGANPRDITDGYTAFETKVGYTLSDHLINATLSAVQSLSLCISICRQTPSCVSVNYNSAALQCQLNNATADYDPYHFVTAAASVTHVWILNGFDRIDDRISNLCTVDSVECAVGNICTVSSYAPSMLACRCSAPLDRSCYMPQDCSALFSFGYMSSGFYIIQPSVNVPAFLTWCDMDVQNQRGYTVLLARNNGGLRFHGRTMQEYSQFFGSPDREFWIGLDNMNYLTSQQKYGYVIEGSLANQAFSPLVGMSTQIKIGNETQNYAIELQSTGSMTTAMNGQAFSSFDMDNDKSASLSCATKTALAGWWYNACNEGLLTGPYQPGASLATSRDGLYVAEINGGVGLSAAKFKITRI